MSMPYTNQEPNSFSALSAALSVNLPISSSESMTESKGNSQLQHLHSHASNMYINAPGGGQIYSEPQQNTGQPYGEHQFNRDQYGEPHWNHDKVHQWTHGSGQQLTRDNVQQLGHANDNQWNHDNGQQWNYDNEPQWAYQQQTTSNRAVPWEQGYRETFPNQSTNNTPETVAGASTTATAGTSVKARGKAKANTSTNASASSSASVGAPILSPFESKPSLPLARESKKRPKRKPRAPETRDINLLVAPDQEIEFEDPSGDPALGPVFVHPPQGSVQACVRCHRIKRKCDGSWPRCTSCSRADVPCVFELGVATSNYIHKLKNTNNDLSSQINTAQDRIRYLESLLTHDQTALLAAAEGPISSPRPSSPSFDNFPSLATSIVSVRHNPALLGLPSVDPPQNLENLGETERSPSPSIPSNDLPDYDDAVQLVDVYFRFNGISYPCLDKDVLMYDLQKAYSRAGKLPADIPIVSVQRSTDDEGSAVRKQFIVMMVLAIGTANSERLGDVERGSSRSYLNRAMHYKSKALEREDILCVQALMLLAIYAMFDPTSSSLWQVIGIAGRVAMSLNLHRRIELSSTVTRRVQEQRSRVFYAVFSIDRLVAATLAKPLAIADNDIDVALPSPQDGDIVYRGVPMIMFTQHIVKLRRLLGIILTTVYSVSGQQNRLTEPERRDIIVDLHSQLDSWVAECPMPHYHDESERTINSHSWFFINYNIGLCMLYRPSPLYPTTTTMRLRALYEASSKCVDLYRELWNEKMVLFNLIQVSAQFVACISLLYSLCECDSRMRAAGAVGTDPSPQAKAFMNSLGLGRFSSADDPAWHQEIRSRMSQSQELLDTFGLAIPLTAKYRDIFSRLCELLLSRYGPLTSKSNVTSRLQAASPTPEATSTPEANQSSPPIQSQSHPLTPARIATQIDLPSLGLEVSSITMDPFPIVGFPTMYNSQLPNLGLEGIPSQIGGAWDAMTQLWFDSGDIIGDMTIPSLTSVSNTTNPWTGVYPAGMNENTAASGHVDKVGLTARAEPQVMLTAPTEGAIWWNQLG